MNLLVLEPSEVAADGACTLSDRRAQHLRDVLGARVGSQVRAGVLGGGRGTAEVLADDGSTISLRVTLAEPPSEPLPIDLVLAVPRPKVLTRAIEIAVSFGVARIELTNAWRVDKSYFTSPRLAPDALTDASRRGAEQGATTYVPPIAVHTRLMKLLDGRWPAGTRSTSHASIETPTATSFEQGPVASPNAAPIETRPGLYPNTPPIETRLVAHPNAALLETVALRGPIVLAIGPEGGWIQREIETFIARGFTPVSLGPPILRVEAALAAALGQLMLLRRVAR